MKNKITRIEELVNITSELKKQGKKIITTNGTFDIVHVAHLNLLSKAKALGDILIVLINSDESVKRFKGKKRPILDENNRAKFLAFLETVDYVSIFEEDTPLKALEIIRPSIHVKGGSFDPNRAVEEKLMLNSWGSQMIFMELEEGYSTSNIINKILKAYGDPVDV